MLTSRFEEALVYANHLHATQLRKGRGIPYIAHLLAVASIALEFGANEDEAIAALLHDAVEDQGGAETLAAIRERFGEEVAAIVWGCSDTDMTPKPPWQERKEAYLAHLPHASGSIRLVSAADKVHNLRTIIEDYLVLGDELWERFRGGKEGTLWYYRAIADALLAIEPTPIAQLVAKLTQELETITRASSL
ncbi:MAG: HD domain-containing protein [Ardenticatenales bacterium]|nr:HD domain-containing protein [Ardenticatenales bacterium]